MGKFIDLTSQRFGRLIVIERADNVGGRGTWNCLCDCGNKKNNVLGKLLRSGHIRSCGCLVGTQNFKDISNQRFGKLLVIRVAGEKDSRGNYLWECECDCGNKIIIAGTYLRNNHTKSCGCLVSEVMSKLKGSKLLGMVFGRLEVVEYLGTNTLQKRIWKCLCSCGNYTTALSEQLISGAIVSCGCFRKEQVRKSLTNDLLGMRFGILEVVEYVGHSESCALWKVVCECGSEKVVKGLYLTNGLQSCGCLQGESLVASRLKVYFIEHFSAVSEYKVFRNPRTNLYLPYDIYLPNENIFIEIQGQQHYKKTTLYHKTDEDFEYQQNKDALKREYAEKQGTYIEIDLRQNDNVEEWITYIENIIRLNNE